MTNLFNIKKIDQKVQNKIYLLVFFIKPPKKTTLVRVAGWLRVKKKKNENFLVDFFKKIMTAKLLAPFF